MPQALYSLWSIYNMHYDIDCSVINLRKCLTKLSLNSSDNTKMYADILAFSMYSPFPIV